MVEIRGELCLPKGDECEAHTSIERALQRCLKLVQEHGMDNMIDRLLLSEYAPVRACDITYRSIRKIGIDDLRNYDLVFVSKYSTWTD